MSSRKLPLFKVGGAATQYTSGMGHGPLPGGTLASQGYTPKVCGAANPMTGPLLVNMAATWEPETESNHHNRHQHVT